MLKWVRPTFFPIRIGNDQGTVEIIGILTYMNDTITESFFEIDLKGLNNYSFTKQIEKTDLIDSSENVNFKDSLNLDFTENAIIYRMNFKAVRSDALFFDVILKNQLENKEIYGLSTIIYRFKRKGTVLNWLTKELKNLEK